MMMSGTSGLDTDQELLMSAWDAVPYKVPEVEEEPRSSKMTQELILVLAIFLLAVCCACASHDLWRRSVYRKEDR